MLLVCLRQHAGPSLAGHLAHAAMLAAAYVLQEGRLLTCLFACLFSSQRGRIAACHKACRTFDAAHRTPVLPEGPPLLQ